MAAYFGLRDAVEEELVLTEESLFLCEVRGSHRRRFTFVGKDVLIPERS